MGLCQMSKKPFGLRFSLRTLLLAILLIASAATLYWNWGPWAPSLHIDVPVKVDNFMIAPGGRWIGAGPYAPTTYEPSSQLKVYDSKSGQLQLDLHDTYPEGTWQT